MDHEQAERFERVIWLEATLRHFEHVPADVVLGTLNTSEAALVAGRLQLDRALRAADARYDLELSNRCAWEMARAAATLRDACPTLDSLRVSFATRGGQDELPDLARRLTAWTSQ